MISIDHMRLMARYNEWQNRNLYAAADALDDEARNRDRGAFFGSIFDTLNHLLWADQIWMHRFSGTEKPEVGRKRAQTKIEHWATLKAARKTLDETIIAWIDGLDPDWLRDDLTWSSATVGRELKRPRWQLVTHLFNHQTHHRGQVHAMLTAAGAKLEDTDLMLMTAVNSDSDRRR